LHPAWLFLQPWRWRWNSCVTLDFNSVHGVMSPEIEVSITIVVGTPKSCYCICFYTTHKSFLFIEHARAHTRMDCDKIPRRYWLTQQVSWVVQIHITANKLKKKKTFKL
jgi:hypothetical protein